MKYRQKRADGQYLGGPMYYMRCGLGERWKPLAALFALSTVLDSLAMGNMTQVNTITAAVQTALPGVRPEPAALATGLAAALLTLLVTMGGAQRIGQVMERMIPLLAGAYVLGALAVIVQNRENLGDVCADIFCGAFCPRAVLGGGTGIGLRQVVRWGVARGVFSNEAGLGSAGIAAAAADTNDPVRQGYISMTGAFFDTVLVCTVTGLAICCSGVLGTTDSFGTPVNGAALTILAFETVLGQFGSGFIAISIVLFAFSTILGWEYQGEQAFSYLTRGRGTTAYRFLYALAVLWGAEQQLDTVYLFSDICNALMCMPNLLCVLMMQGEVVRDMKRHG
jgi:AGCS family alanine or glycine:cation symporter